ncbi:hypothetical protein LCGC14_0496180 [marine sediment metagenome]|uniref:Uncharacterized protein n=1 Tax=marine sediment metagenome TaxID=412755 RepID=A0A0F9US32_9ZZZZ
MGRKKKFGEESDFVSVRVPKSKRKEYRIAIKDFVENKFERNGEGKKIEVSKDKLDGFKKFDEFIKEIKEKGKEKDKFMSKAKKEFKKET